MGVLNIVKLLVSHSCRRSFASSALFISNRSTKERPILTPTLDLNAKFQDISLLQENVKARKMDMDIISLKSLWEVYNELNTVRLTLEQRRTDIADRIKTIMKSSSKESNSADKLRLEGRIVREDLKQLLKAFWEVEEKLMTSCLLLPNDLHERTPLAEDEVLEICEAKSSQAITGLNAAQLVDYRSPQCFYLKNEAALFDLALPEYIVNGMRSGGFIGLNGPDFANSAVIEACGTLPEAHARLEPIETSLNLVGGSSIYPLCAFYAKQDIPVENFPIKNFTTGRNYSVAIGPGLFGAWQKNTVDFLTIVTNPAEILEEFEKTSELLSTLYRSLGWKCKVVNISAPNLSPWECSRMSIQMLSNSMKQWVEVGKVSISGSFIPERMSITFKRKDNSKGFCQVLSGTAVDVTSVLACLLEENEPALFPPKLEPFLLARP